ncbi:DUF5606 domain-containing protein [Olivibacter sp. XZL3]|uniref:DUF5606 family protein n=1 Tax=Olivibacter sp. XZL3 TaxID=1735116 RepID=UPI0010664E14|nr:DUF5606 domain-containing protein [Olivibacter sp. XZL3]
MNLRGIVSVTGRPGLFKLIGQNKTGFILESLDEKRVKIVVNISTAKMASLEDITIFGSEEDIKLIDIFEKMKEMPSLPDAKKDSGEKLRAFFNEVAPDHDQERVYSSDIKKIINWFNILKELPLFNEEAPAPVTGGGEGAENPVQETAK